MTDFGWRLVVAIFAVAVVSVLLSARAARGTELYAAPNSERPFDPCITMTPEHVKAAAAQDGPCDAYRVGRLIFLECKNTFYLMTSKKTDCERLRAFLYATDPL